MTTKKPTTLPAILTTETIDGVPIVFREDGYINLTKIMKHHPEKKLAKFWENDSTKEYLAVLSKFTQIPVNSLYVTRGRAGTWAHPKLAVRVARWLNTEFEVKCDLLIDNILRGNVVATAVVRTQEAEEVTAQFAAMQTRILGLEAENQRLQEEGLREGEIPTGWLTCWNYLEDQGHGIPFISAAVKEFGSLCSSEHKRMRLAAATRKKSQGTKDRDAAYYHPDALAAAYEKLLRLYELKA